MILILEEGLKAILQASPTSWDFLMIDLILLIWKNFCSSRYELHGLATFLHFAMFSLSSLENIFSLKWENLEINSFIVNSLCSSTAFLLFLKNDIQHQIELWAIQIVFDIALEENVFLPENVWPNNSDDNKTDMLKIWQIGFKNGVSPKYPSSLTLTNSDVISIFRPVNQKSRKRVNSRSNCYHNFLVS